MEVDFHWGRLLDYLERMGAPCLLRFPIKERADIGGYTFQDQILPEEYRRFVDVYGHPTLYIDEDVCLAFLHPHLTQKHPLYAMGVYPFAVCSSDCQITVAFEWSGEGWLVVVYDQLERIDIEGDFIQWLEAQVRQFLVVLMNYNFQELQARQFSLRQDPLELTNEERFSMIS